MTSVDNWNWLAVRSKLVSRTRLLSSLYTNNIAFLFYFTFYRKDKAKRYVTPQQ